MQHSGGFPQCGVSEFRSVEIGRKVGCLISAFSSVCSFGAIECSVSGVGVLCV